MRAKRLALVTVGKEAIKPPTEEWKKKILIAEQNKSQKEKINTDRSSKRQDETVTHIMDVNAQELIFMARRRLCGMASPETRQVMEEITRQVVDVCPEFKDVLVRNCKYLGRCPEMNNEGCCF